MATTTPGYSMVKFTHLDDAFSEIFELEASPVEVQSLQLTFIHSYCSKGGGDKGKAQKIKKYEKPKDVGHFHVHK